MWGFFWAIFYYKTGEKLRFWAIVGPPVGVTAIYIYIYIEIEIERERDRESGEIERDNLNGTNGAKFAVFHRFSLIFADFRFFSWKLQHFGFADFRTKKKPQETTEFRRKPQETADFCRNPFVPFSLSLLIPPCERERDQEPKGQRKQDVWGNFGPLQ